MKTFGYLALLALTAQAQAQPVTYAIAAQGNQALVAIRVEARQAVAREAVAELAAALARVEVTAEPAAEAAAVEAFGPIAVCSLPRFGASLGDEATAATFTFGGDPR